MIFLIFNYNTIRILPIVIARNGNKSVKTIQEYGSDVRTFKGRRVYNTKIKVGNKILFS